MKYAFYPGCSLESTSWDFAHSTRAVCAALDIELEEIEGWTCCGSTPAHASNRTLALALPVLNLQKASQSGAPVMAACASCYARLRLANHKVATSEIERSRAERVTGAPYDGHVRIQHLLDVLVNEYGPKRLRERIKHPLSGLKLACYYGCLLSRPPEVVAFDDPEHPSCMETALEAAGATTVSWPLRTECCGAGLSLTHTDVVCRLAHRLVSAAKSAGADVIAVACPMCQTNLEMRQGDSAKVQGEPAPVPVAYVTQLLGIALGIAPRKLGLRALGVSPLPLLQQNVPQLSAAGGHHGL
jgi:heterodisulfide reductase subunit B